MRRSLKKRDQNDLPQPLSATRKTEPLAAQPALCHLTLGKEFGMESKADALASFRARDLAPVESALKEIEEKFRASRTQGGVTAIRHFPAREPQVAPFPASLPPRLTEILKARGFASLYTHQAQAFTLAREGKNLVVVTPTASGKTLCYNLPILSELVENPEARALYLFPTKALSQDQLVELNRWTEQLGDQVRTFTYDGDTPQDARKAIRARGNLVITNPDMLHTGILPHHTKWQRLFENLRYVVIDELHYYRGVLGSHWPTSCAGSSAWRVSTEAGRSSSAPRPRLPIRRSWPRSSWKKM